ncbi:MAG: imelysin family protein [Pseudomonadota bacterium]
MCFSKYGIGVVILALTISGCGGGGGGGSAAPPPTTNPPPADPLGPVGTLAEEQDRLFLSIGENVIVPGYASMKTSMDMLVADTQTTCSTPDSTTIAALQDSWRAAMLAWQRVSIVRFGPVEENNRRFRIQFFPDANNAVINNTTAVLNGGQSIDETLIASSPVGAQGLPAIEYIVFELGGLDDPATGPRRCEMLLAVSANLATLADELAIAWDSSGQLLADFTSASGVYMDRTEVLTEILESIAQDTEFVADEKLTRPIATGANTTESFRSEHSLENLLANVDATRAILDVGSADTDYGLRDYLARAHDANAISTQIDGQLGTAESGLAALSDSVESIILGTGSGDLDTIRSSMQDLADSFIDAAIAADVNLGFNNQDGD